MPQRKILITAGPTWIKVDAVRILTTVFTGSTGLFFAKELAKKGYAVTLLINPFRLNEEIKRIKNVKIVPFYYFQDLKAGLEKLLTKSQYDVIIHNAAVSDYGLKKVFTGKIASRKSSLKLILSPMPKLINYIRNKANKAKLIQFKLEVDEKALLKKACESLKQNKSDFVVANLLKDVKSDYKAWIIDKAGNKTKVNSKKELVEKFKEIITGERL